MVGGGGKWDCMSERVRGGGATVIPLSSSMRSALEVLSLAYSTYGQCKDLLR